MIIMKGLKDIVCPRCDGTGLSGEFMGGRIPLMCTLCFGHKLITVPTETKRIDGKTVKCPN
jgi:hypothetical protein